VESPRHRVQIAKGFEIGMFEVTQAQWLSVMGASPSYGKGKNPPVETVSWYDTQDFMTKLNARNDGYRYRLPTEAEWEYAARAGTTDKYVGGIQSEIACMDWYNTCDVGSFKPNAWGLYDTIGNVREFCQDWMADNYYTISPAADPPGPATGTNKVTRGGAWGIVGIPLLPVSSRSVIAPDVRNLIFGFRVVRQKTP
jgi:formylglycine-generating enzyme required for sulfatase activity